MKYLSVIISFFIVLCSCSPDNVVVEDCQDKPPERDYSILKGIEMKGIRVRAAYAGNEEIGGCGLMIQIDDTTLNEMWNALPLKPIFLPEFVVKKAWGGYIFIAHFVFTGETISCIDFRPDPAPGFDPIPYDYPEIDIIEIYEE